MYKEELIEEIEKLEEEINTSNKKTYIINTRIKRLLIFLRKYTSEAQCNELVDLIQKLDSCDITVGYGGTGIYNKEPYLNLLKDIKQTLN